MRAFACPLPGDGLHANRERGQRIVGIKHHLLRLARIGHNEHLTAVSQPEMRQFDRRRGSAQHDMLVAPVKLRHITGRREQRHKRLRARRSTRFNLPLPHMTLNAVIGTGISLSLKTFEQPTRCPLPCFGQKPITAQPLIKTAAPWSKLWSGLRLALVDRLNPILQIFANPQPLLEPPLGDCLQSPAGQRMAQWLRSATAAGTAPSH